MKPAGPPVPSCMLSLLNFMANVYEHLLHGMGPLHCCVSPLIIIATVDLSTEGVMTLWLFLPGIFERQPTPVGTQS